MCPDPSVNCDLSPLLLPPVGHVSLLPIPQLRYKFWTEEGTSVFKCSMNISLVRLLLVVHQILCSIPYNFTADRVRLKCDGTRWRAEGEMKGKLVNGVGSQYSSHYLGTCCIQHYYRWCAPVVDWSDAPCRFKWTRLFCWKTKSGFCACAITFQMQSAY